MHDILTEERRKFQLDRLILFSDAVFAIAITLLIIEIHAPELDGLAISDASFFKKLLDLTPQFIGFMMSFALIGMYWARHHAVFGFISSYSPRLIFLNLLLLFSIVLMPFSTQVYSLYITPEYIQLLGPFLLYTLNIMLCGLANYWIWVYITRPGNPVCKQVFTKRFIRNAKRRSLVLPFAFFISFLFCWIFHSIWGRYLLLLIPLYFRLIKDEPRDRKNGKKGNDNYR